jgi:hypothetical protein
MNRLARQLLRIALVVLLLGSLLAQVLLPVFASQQGEFFPELTDLVVPYSVAGILVIACSQVALLAVWRLLSLVNSGVIFTSRALRWVNVITACAAAATVLSAGVMIHLLVFVGVGGPGVLLGVAATLAGGLSFVLLMVVMRGLLDAAIADRTELDEVI